MTSDFQKLRKRCGERSDSSLDGKEIDAQGNAQYVAPMNNSTNSGHSRSAAPSTIIHQSLGDMPAPLWLRDRKIESHVSGLSQNPSHTTVRPHLASVQDQYQPVIVQENPAKQAPLLYSSLPQEPLESEYLNRDLIPDPLRTRKPALSLSTTLQSQNKPLSPPTRDRPGSFIQQALSAKTSSTPRFGGSPFELPKVLHDEELSRVRMASQAEKSPAEASGQYTGSLSPLSLPVRNQRESGLFTPGVGGSELRELAMKQHPHTMDSRRAADVQMIRSNDQERHRPTNQQPHYGISEATRHLKVYNAKRIIKWVQQATMDEIMEDSDDSMCDAEEYLG